MPFWPGLLRTPLSTHSITPSSFEHMLEVIGLRRPPQIQEFLDDVYGTDVRSISGVALEFAVQGGQFRHFFVAVSYRNEWRLCPESAADASLADLFGNH